MLKIGYKSNFQALVLLDFATLGWHTGHKGDTSVTQTLCKELTVLQVCVGGPRHYIGEYKW